MSRGLYGLNNIDSGRAQCLTYKVVQFCSVVSDSLWPRGLKHTRPSCPSPTPRVYSNSCLLSRWCHPTISSPSPAFNLSQHQGLFQWVSFSHQVAKVLGVSASASVLPMKNQDWFPLGWTHWISLHHSISNFLAALVHVFYPKSICNFKNLSLCSWSWNNARVRSSKP